MAAFLILHGWRGSEPDHWQSWLARRLRDAGHEVAYPDLPDPDRPRRAAWLRALADALAAETVPQTVVCHSLGCLLWLHHAARPVGPRVERALLVAPPSPSCGLEPIAEFLELPDADLAAAAGATRLVCSDDDPYCVEGARDRYARYSLPTDVVPGGGHLNTDAGYGPWPAVEAWCRGASSSVGR